MNINEGLTERSWIHLNDCRPARAGILLLLLLLFTLPTVVQGQFTFTTNNGTITITGYTGTNAVVVIPSITNGYPITGIGLEAFWGCFSLTSVTIPSSVTNIGDAPFGFCAGLRAISVDPLNAFYSSADGVLFNKAQTTLIQYPIGNGATSYTIPNSVSSIGVQAFVCSSLSNVTIGNGVTNIGDFAFHDCGSLTNVTIPNSVTSIGHEAFYGCDSLTNVTIPNSVTSIGQAAFLSCWGLTSVTIGNGVIGVDAFDDCLHLTSVTIGNGVTSIGAGAFYYCINLSGVYFRGNAPDVDDSAFSYQVEVITNGGWSPIVLWDPATVYYLPGTTGWGTTFGGLPTALWFLPNPLILNDGPSFGVQANRFGFTISWATNISVVVEASTNLANPTWTPITTNTLSGGSAYFSDPRSTNYPGRFYRLRWP